MTIKDKDAPTRHPIEWEDPAFYDEQTLDEEMRRVFDVCHGCRRCFNLCDSFPRLFDLVDNSPTGELDSVKSEDFKPVVEACTLCDMCFVNKCPYVPPHPFNIDFPHLMLRYRAVEQQKKSTPFVQKEIVKMDRNASLAKPFAPLVNWALDEKNTLTRPMIEKVTGIDKRAFVPKFEKETFVAKSLKNSIPANEKAPGFGEKVVLYATCYGNYHQTSVAEAALKLLKHHGVETEVLYPGCCGMPLLEQGNLSKVAKTAEHIADIFAPWIDKGYKILGLFPSCTLMLKQEWPLLLPQQNNIQRLAKHTMDVSEYLVQLIKKKGFPEKPHPLGDHVTLHLACHSRAQNIGAKAAELLRFIPDTIVNIIERCSGHGGSWGMMKENFDTALYVGTPVFKQAIHHQNKYIASECPLAAQHIRQGMEVQIVDVSSSDAHQKSLFHHAHPLEIFAYACGLTTL